jgi:asparagine synthase (glutamine-hydrolysing)
MSAIAGIFNRDGAPVVDTDLRAMAGAIAWYGPDGQGIWLDDGIGLAHLMLHTTPESRHERLPAQDPIIAHLTVTADAWLDNRDELLDALRIGGERRGLPDSSLILLAYEKWGDDCVDKLLGDFAFAIWDARRRRLFCGRDLFGAKPFLYYADRRRFIFASDINAILAVMDREPAINPAMIAIHLQRNTYYPQKRLTFFEEIQKLPPAHRMTVDERGVRLEPYWRPQDVPRVRLSSDAAYAEQLHALIGDAVAARLRTDLPVGSHLSGGLDSSTVTVHAARLLHRRDARLNTFSWSPAFERHAPVEDERLVVDEIGRLEDIDVHYLDTGTDDMLRAATRDMTTEPYEMIWREEQVQETAARHGVRIMLSGWGGDELASYGGYGYLAGLFRDFRWLTLHRALAARARVLSPDGSWPVLTRRYLGVMRARVIGLIAPMRIRPWLGNGIVVLNERTFIHPAFARQQRRAVAAISAPAAVNQVPGVHAQQRRSIEYGHLTRRLEDWTANGARHRIVYRYPLLDRRIVEFALGIPEETFYRTSQTRVLMRTACADLLPPRLLNRQPKDDAAGLRVVGDTLQQSPSRWYDEVAGRRSPAEQYLDMPRLAAARQRGQDIEVREAAAMSKALALFHVRRLR